MLQQIKQIAITYLAHRKMLIGVLVWGGLMLAPQLIAIASSSSGSADAAQPIAMVLGMPLVFFMPFLVGHVKMQFAHPRCRLMPRFLPPHLTTLCGLLGVLLFGCPLLIARLTGFEPLGLVALALATAVPAIWGAHFGRFLWYFIAIAVFYSLLTDWGVRWWILEASQHRALHALVVMANGSLLAGWLWRLAHLYEESDDYLVVFNWRIGRRSEGEQIEQRRLIAAWLRRSKFTAMISDSWLRRIGGYHGGAPWRLVRLMQFGAAMIPPELNAAMMAVMLLGVTMFMIEFSFIGRDSGPGSLWFMVQLAILMPGMFAGESLFQRRPRMAPELLRPLSRTQYCNAILAASSWNVATAWAIMHAALAVALLRVTEGQLSLAPIAMFVLLSAATALAALGLGIRLAVWDSYMKRMGVTMLAWLGLAMPIAAWWALRDDFGDWPFALVAAVMAALGVGLIREARHAWLNLELG
jgi:hypothetical protein